MERYASTVFHPPDTEKKKYITTKLTRFTILQKSRSIFNKTLSRSITNGL